MSFRKPQLGNRSLTGYFPKIGHKISFIVPKMGKRFILKNNLSALFHKKC
jgi:hypothetical protein